MPIFVRRIPGEETMPEEGTRVAVPRRRGGGGAGMSVGSGTLLVACPSPHHSCFMTSWKKLFLLLCFHRGKYCFSKCLGT